MYKSKYRSRLGYDTAEVFICYIHKSLNPRRYIETKLPSLLVRLPFRVPAPASWCICHDDPREEDQEDHEDHEDHDDDDQDELDPRCMVHGFCDECEVGRISF